MRCWKQFLSNFELLLGTGILKMLGSYIKVMIKIKQRRFEPRSNRSNPIVAFSLKTLRHYCPVATFPDRLYCLHIKFRPLCWFFFLWIFYLVEKSYVNMKCNDGSIWILSVAWMRIFCNGVYFVAYFGERTPINFTLMSSNFNEKKLFGKKNYSNFVSAGHSWEKSKIKLSAFICCTSLYFFFFL